MGGALAAQIALRVLDLISAGIERETILAQVQQMAADGASGEQIADALAKMADDAIDALDKDKG